MQEQRELTQDEKDILGAMEVDNLDTLKAPLQAPINQKPSKFSDVSDNKLTLSDFYHDTRTFLDKANSTKFILLIFLMLSIPALLVTGYITDKIYEDMVIIIALTYLGVDVYEKRGLIKKAK